MLPHQYQQQTLHCIPPPLQSQHFPMYSFSIPPEPSRTYASRQAVPDFPQFNKLPAEIRTMIWEFALPDARVYEIMDVPHAKQKMNAVDGLMFANIHHEPPPALAAVCHESRYLVLRRYRPLTLGRTTKYVDLARDLLLLEPYLLLKRLHRTLHFMSRIPLIRTHMAGLALGTSYGIYTGICHPVLSWKVSKSNMGKLLTGLAKFPKLKALLFVVHQEFQFEFDYQRFPAPESLLQPLRSLPPVCCSSSTSSSAYSTPSPRPSPRRADYLPQLQPPPALRLAPLLPPSQIPTQILPQILPQISQTPQIPPPPPPPQPAAPQEARPQIVHQAYHFKFDVEANINRHPRRPHLNDLLFYPLEVAQGDDDKDDWEALLNNSSSSASAAGPSAHAGVAGSADMGMGMDDTESGEWCDPWPTNDDWRRFRRRFQRAVVATLQSGLADSGDGQNAFYVDEEAEEAEMPCRVTAAAAGDKKHQQHARQQQRCATSSVFGDGYGYAHGCSTHFSSHDMVKNGTGHRRRYSLQRKLPAIKGASLLWRYNRGV